MRLKCRGTNAPAILIGGKFCWFNFQFFIQRRIPVSQAHLPPSPASVAYSHEVHHFLLQRHSFKHEPNIILIIL